MLTLVASIIFSRDLVSMIAQPGRILQCTHDNCKTANVIFRTRFPLSWLQNSRTFPGPHSIYPWPSRKPAMFKYSNKQQLMSLGEHCNLCQCGPGRNPGRKSIFDIPVPRKRTWWQQLRLFSSAVTCLIKTKNCHVHHCLANSRTFQGQGYFPGLSRS